MTVVVFRSVLCVRACACARARVSLSHFTLYTSYTVFAKVVDYYY